MTSEQAITFQCHDEELVGIFHAGENTARRGVLIVVGGPQYRVGSHRQFVLLARSLARAGLPVMRFDYRSMGDADGEFRDFEDIDDDIKAALDVFFLHHPQLQEVVIWGLCDAASAALFYAWQDRRVAGLVLLNPWVRTEAGIAKAYLKNYYLARLLSPDLWRKIRRGEFDVKASLRSLSSMAASTLKKNLPTPTQAGESAITNETTDSKPAMTAQKAALPDRMAEGLEKFKGPVLLILSGNDLTAAEFKDVAKSARRWRRLLAKQRVRQCELAAADHTFASREWRGWVEQQTVDWIKSLNKQ